MRDKRAPKRGTNAKLLLDMLSERHPEGLAVGEAAVRIFGVDTPATRQKTYRSARVLRDMGYLVYAIGGVYYLCGGDAEKLHLINERKKKIAIGNFDSLTWTLNEAESALQGSPDGVWESKCRELKESLLREMLERIQKIS